MPPKKRLAFTLIELLVVVAIIALLIALLVPALSRAQAHLARCLANQHAIGLAMNAYASEYARFPRCNGGGPPNPADADQWVPNNGDITKGCLYPYLSNIDKTKFVCPVDIDYQTRGYKFSYAMNCQFSLIQTIRIHNPSGVILVIDDELRNDNMYWWWATKANGYSKPDYIAFRHRSAGNPVATALFADAHAESLSNAHENEPQYFQAWNPQPLNNPWGSGSITVNGQTLPFVNTWPP